MARAQIARDLAIAEAIRPYFARGVVLLTGNGHARRDIGVPFFLRAESGRRRSPSACSSATRRRRTGPGASDVAFATPVQPREDPVRRSRRAAERRRAVRAKGEKAGERPTRRKCGRGAGAARPRRTAAGLRRHGASDKRRLLAELGTLRFDRAKQLLALQRVVSFLSAFPDDAAVHRAARRLATGFAARVARLPKAEREQLDDSGAAGQPDAALLRRHRGALDAAALCRRGRPRLEGGHAPRR